MYKVNELQGLNRTKQFLKDPESEKFLENFNRILRGNEIKNYSEVEETLPTIFIHGLPRSGTTLLMQFLINQLDLGYVNNLVARFWLAPVYGFNLSKVLLKPDVLLNYESSYGKTIDLFGPHEFAFFWTHWLKMENMPPYFPDQMRKKIDWKGLMTVLMNIALTTGKPMIYKGILPGYHIEQFLNRMQKSIFIYVERDTKDVACSLYDARIAYYNDPSRWWSIYPDSYESIKDLPYNLQIPRQVHDLEQQFTKYIEQLPPHCQERVVRIKLEEFCDQPEALIDKIQLKIRELSSPPLLTKQNPVKPFTYSPYKKSSDAYKAISEGISLFLE